MLSIIILISLAITIGLALISQGQELIDSVSTFLNSLISFVESLEEFIRERNRQRDLSNLEQGLRNQAVYRLVNFLVIFQSNPEFH